MFPVAESSPLFLGAPSLPVLAPQGVENSTRLRDELELGALQAGRLLMARPIAFGRTCRLAHCKAAPARTYGAHVDAVSLKRHDFTRRTLHVA